MMTPDTRKFVDEHVWAYLRGELDASRSAEFEQLLLEDEDAAAHVSRLHTLMLAGRSQEVGAWAPDLDRGALFARIDAELDEHADATSQGERRSGVRPWHAVVALAVAAIAAAALSVALHEPAARRDDPPVTTADHAPAAPAPAPQPSGQGAVPESAPELALDASALARLSADVRVVATAGAQVRLDEGNPAVLHVDSGLAVVEYIPVSGHGLRVETADFEFDVVGTVFVVAADPERPYIEVVWGAVELEREGGDLRLAAGERAGRSGEITQISATSPTELEAASRNMFDLVAHAEAIARSSAGPTLPSPGEPSTDHHEARRRPRDSGGDGTTSPPSPVVAGPEALIAQGRAELRAGNITQAAMIWEQALVALPSGHVDEPVLRLDLANLYLNRLSDNARAERHLRTFIDRFPDDPESTRARTTLCRLPGARDTAPSECGGSAARD